MSIRTKQAIGVTIYLLFTAACLFFGLRAISQ